MSPVLDQLGATIAWLGVFAPMLSLGLVMVMDPPGFRSLLRNFADALHRFSHQLHARWQEPPFLPIPGPVSSGSDFPVRVIGAVLVSVSLLGLWEALR
jgi:hypothetical protein